MAEFLTVAQYDEEAGNAFPPGDYGNEGYILELHKRGGSGKLGEGDWVSLIYVNGIQMQQSHAVDRVFTFSSIYEQHSGFRERNFTFSGRTGDQYKDHVKFYKLRNFIENYASLKEETENAFTRNKTWRLSLCMLWEMEYFECTILNFSYQREAGSTTNSYVYNLTIAVHSVWNEREPVELQTPASPPPVATPAAIAAEAPPAPVTPPEEAPAADTGGTPVTQPDGSVTIIRERSDPYVSKTLASERIKFIDARLLEIDALPAPSVKESNEYYLLMEERGILDDVISNESRTAALKVQLEEAEAAGDEAVVNALEEEIDKLEDDMDDLEDKLEDVRERQEDNREAGASAVDRAANLASITAGSVDGGSGALSFASAAGTSPIGGTLAGLAGSTGAVPADANALKKKSLDIVSKTKEDVKKVAAVAKDVSDKTSTKSRADTSWWEDVTGFVGGTDAALYNNVVTTLTAPLNELAKVRNLVAPIQAGLSSLSYASRSLVGAYYSFLPNMKSYAFGTVANVRSSLEDMKRTYGMLEDMTSERYWRELGSGWENIWGSSWESRRTGGVYLPTANTQVAPVPVPGGVTSAYDAAQRLLGDRGRWSEVVAANNMRYPYTKQDGTFINVGDVILIPTNADTSVPSQSISLNGTFGSDLMIKDGDLVMKGTGSFQTVEGVANFQQNLSHRMRTERGTNRAFPNFGLPRTLNEKQTSTLLAQFWANVRTQAISDRRVKRVKRLIVSERATQFIAQLTVELANMKTQTITLNYTPPI
jgi:hypothetical protein